MPPSCITRFLSKIHREQLETGVAVVLRIPSLFIVELCFRTDPLKSVPVGTRAKDVHLVANFIYYAAFILAITLAVLPLKKLVNFYMYLVSALLLTVSYHVSFSYVEDEKTLGFDHSPFNDLRENPARIQELLLYLCIQWLIGALIAYLLDIKNWTKYLTLAFSTPVLAHLAGVPVEHLSAVHNVASTVIISVILLHLFNSLSCTLDFVKSEINRLWQIINATGWLPIIVSLWHTIMLPTQLLLFWMVLFCTQLYIYLSAENNPIIQEGWLVMVLASIGECCATPVSLFALCVTISYASYYILTLTKLYLQGWNAIGHDNDGMRGWTEGFTMLLIAMQTGLLELRPLQRAFLMSILLFIVASSLIQSMYEMTDPILLTLSASRNGSIFKHLRAVVLCTFLWMFPLYMTYMICQYLDLDFWLLVIISSCLLTSVQVIGSLAIYVLFMYDYVRNEPWESLDDVIYYARSTTRVLEFIVAVFVVCYGLKETLFGVWSWINSSILIIHCYFNVWQRLQSGWKSFLQRREAVKMLESMPCASQEQLKTHGDVCAICFQEMTVARITKCNHFFHGFCLRKWLYVKDACPMCHQKVSSIYKEEESPVVSQNNNTEDGGTETESGAATELFQTSVSKVEPSTEATTAGQSEAKPSVSGHVSNNVPASLIDEDSLQKQQEVEAVASAKLEEFKLEQKSGSNLVSDKEDRVNDNVKQAHNTAGTPVISVSEA
ncbi:RING finger protein 145-like [Octopus sinensis]|uniref:RING finger protein 145-like n=1 Tax=Octopus sinensis TaxID=2607531 RepID=A0A6P7TE47_9MOLL|nr:RING finger protein 145-like [Octopus sinensis]